jgi:hypothetical protein
VRNDRLVESEVPSGRWTQVRIEKEKSTRPNREGSFLFDYELRSIDPVWELISLGLEDGLIERSSVGQYEYVDLADVSWKGTAKKFHTMIAGNPELYEELENAIATNTEGDA